MSEQYKKDYLSQVIIRVDFSNNIDSIKNNINEELNKLILKYFQVPEPRKLLGQSFQFQVSNKKEVKSDFDESMEWKYFNRNRTKYLLLNLNSMLIDYKVHEDHKLVIKEFFEILKKLFDLYSDIQVRRFGLRYINNIDLDIKEIKELSKYINKDLLSIFNFYENKELISRVINHIEFNFDNLKLRFQSGMRNPDYPAIIRRNIFVLDYDCYYEGLLSNVNEIEQKAIETHGKIKEFFSKSITKQLKDKMNEKI